MLEGHRSTFKAYTNMLEPDIYVEMVIKKDKKGWQNKSPIQSIKLPYQPTRILHTIGTQIPGQKSRQKSKVLLLEVCVTDKTDNNPSPTQKELLN